MNESIELSVLILMGASIAVLILEAIEKKPPSGFANNKPHIRLFAQAAICGAFFCIAFPFNFQEMLYKKSNLYIYPISSLFLIINTWIALFLVKYTLAKNQSGEIYFLFLASLAMSLVNVCADTLVIKFVCSCGWLILMTALVIKTTPGGKKVEAALKLCFTTLVFGLFFIASIYFAAFDGNIDTLTKITLITPSFASLSFIAVVFFALAGLCLSGIPPFHYGHIDCADGGNPSIAFLLLSSSVIQGSSHILAAKSIFIRSGISLEGIKEVLGLVLALGLVIIWLRALDQRSVRRTITYVAASISSLFCLALLFGASTELPSFAYFTGLFSFLTLSLFTLYGALTFMNPIYLPHQTWEDMAGFGRNNILQTLYFLIAIASIAGLPGTLGYFVKLSLIGPMNETWLFNSLIFLSMAMGAACTLRIFVFAFSKHSHSAESTIKNPAPPLIFVITSAILIALGLFPFVR